MYQNNNGYYNGQQQQQQQQQQIQQNQGLLLQGRIVWTSGKLFEGKPMLDDNNRPVTDEQGNQVIQFGFGLAIPKMDRNNPSQYSEQFQKYWQLIQAEARTIFPSGNFPNDFAWKYKDGDTNDHNGKPFADREGYKGCVVIACTTQIPIKFFKWEGNTNILVNSGIKCGDYVNVQLNIKAHPAKGRGKAGLYMNPTACQLIAEGKEIINAPSGDQLFGMVAPSYAGEIIAPEAPTMPIGNNNNMGGMPNMNPNQGQQFNNGGMPNMNPNQGQNFQQNNNQVDPHYGVLPNSHQPNQGQGGMPNMNPNQGQGGMPNMNPNQGQQFNNGGMPNMNNMGGNFPNMPR